MPFKDDPYSHFAHISKVCNLRAEDICSLSFFHFSRWDGYNFVLPIWHVYVTPQDFHQGHKRDQKWITRPGLSAFFWKKSHCDLCFILLVRTCDFLDRPTSHGLLGVGKLCTKGLLWQKCFYREKWYNSKMCVFVSYFSFRHKFLQNTIKMSIKIYNFTQKKPLKYTIYISKSKMAKNWKNLIFENLIYYSFLLIMSKSLFYCRF